MKKYITTSIVIGSFLLYSFAKKNPQPADVASILPTASVVSSEEPILTPMIRIDTSAKYKDGVYTGTRADAFYGYIQVRATVTNGKLADITFLEYPNDHHESVQINERAMPLLQQEAVANQNANVDIITRATDTSLAFKESLAAALAQAAN